MARLWFPAQPTRRPCPRPRDGDSRPPFPRSRSAPWGGGVITVAAFLGIRLYWRGETALKGSHLCVRGLVHACTDVVVKVVRGESHEDLWLSDRAREARRSMGSAEVAGARGWLGAAGNDSPLSTVL